MQVKPHCIGVREREREGERDRVVWETFKEMFLKDLIHHQPEAYRHCGSGIICLHMAPFQEKGEKSF